MLDFYKNLAAQEWAALIPFGMACAAVGFTAKMCMDTKVGCRFLCFAKDIINPSIKKNEAKVVHSFDMEDLGNKTSFCRCWRSSKFPYCDGTHNKHNEATGDNIGPLTIKKKDN